MNEDLKKSRVVRFVSDETTSNAVYEVIRDTFLKNKGQRDVQILAAERLALDLLDAAWNEMKKYNPDEGSESAVSRQVGL